MTAQLPKSKSCCNDILSGMVFISAAPEVRYLSTCRGWPGHVDESIEQRASLLAALRALWPERSTKTHRVEYADHVVQNTPVVTGCQVVANFKFATNNG